MIASVHIKGFQSHVDSQLNLSPGLTVLTGPTDSGKTALIRAIRWIAFNEPAGENFINQATGEAIVTITLSDGTDIIKGRRKGGRTVYRLVPAIGIPQHFEQADVPLEVTAALGITRQTFGDFETALNFAFQLDAPFLISEPPSAGAKVLGKIAGTEIVDQALKSVAKDTYGARQDKLLADKQIEQKTEELKEYDGVDQLKEQVEACELLLEKFEQLRARHETLSMLERQKERSDEQLSKLEAELQRYASLPAAEQNLQDVETGAQRLQLLSDLAQRYERLEISVSQYGQELTLYVGLEQAAEQVLILDQLLGKAATLIECEDRYLRIIENIKNATAVLTITKDLDVATGSLADVEQGMQRLNDLRLLAGQHQAHTVTIAARQKLLDALQGIAQADPLLAGLDEQRSKLDRLRELQAIYRIKNNTLEDAGRKAAAAVTAVASQERIIQDLWAEVDICPLCNRAIEKGEKIRGH
ncbi:AAA family ATPase|uniref:Nuclease SbcCD subunit C n=1 Tax=Dendrosporobacter quercicolus TaxID=146817 RepID=A0A1G9ZV78_9FIRM|nr:AAA family ATPase [Dendrosporobacter quercicolus]NSL49615.1 AAA family ATPase [Dendrosporobacter quercicolus DSM 1736]SDN25035.1 exonuclease SbcC [Dendrosporobacter quercicolus]